MASGFPPAQAPKSVPKTLYSADYKPVVVPTGKTIADTLKVKAAGTKDAPGLDKDVNLF